MRNMHGIVGLRLRILRGDDPVGRRQHGLARARLHHKAFDPYPYILLNLFLSMMAGVQAAALLIAAKRADAISSEVAVHTSNNTDDIKRLIQENTELTEAVKSATDLLDEIHLHVANIGAVLGAEGGKFAPRTPPSS